MASSRGLISSSLDPIFESTWSKILNEDNLDWVLLEFTTTIKLQESGVGGIKVIRSLLRDDSVQFGGFKLTANLNAERSSSIVKFISFTWFGSKVGGIKKAKARTFVNEIKKVFKGSAVNFEVVDGDMSSLEEIKIENLIKATGLTYFDIDFDNMFNPLCTTPTHGKKVSLGANNLMTKKPSFLKGNSSISPPKVVVEGSDSLVGIVEEESKISKPVIHRSSPLFIKEENKVKELEKVKAEEKMKVGEKLKVEEKIKEEEIKVTDVEKKEFEIEENAKNLVEKAKEIEEKVNEVGKVNEIIKEKSLSIESLVVSNEKPLVGYAHIQTIAIPTEMRGKTDVIVEHHSSLDKSSNNGGQVFEATVQKIKIPEEPYLKTNPTAHEDNDVDIVSLIMNEVKSALDNQSEKEDIFFPAKQIYSLPLKVESIIESEVPPSSLVENIIVNNEEKVEKVEKSTNSIKLVEEENMTETFDLKTENKTKIEPVETFSFSNEIKNVDNTTSSAVFLDSNFDLCNFSKAVRKGLSVVSTESTYIGSPLNDSSIPVIIDFVDEEADEDIRKETTLIIPEPRKESNIQTRRNTLRMSVEERSRLDTLLLDEIQFAAFKAFLIKRVASERLLFYLDVQNLKNKTWSSDGFELKNELHRIYSKYFVAGSDYEISSLDPKQQADIEKIIFEPGPKFNKNVLDSVQDIVNQDILNNDLVAWEHSTSYFDTQNKIKLIKILEEIKSLSGLLMHPLPLKYFTDYLNAESKGYYLEFYLEVEEFRKCTAGSMANIAINMFIKYIREGNALNYLKITNETRSKISANVFNLPVSRKLFDEAQKEAFAYLEKEYVPKFQSNNLSFEVEMLIRAKYGDEEGYYNPNYSEDFPFIPRHTASEDVSKIMKKIASACGVTATKLVRAGKLWKKGSHVYSIWKCRFVVLTSDNRLLWFSDESCKDLIRSVDIILAEIIDRHGDSVATKQKMPHQLELSYIYGKSIIFASENDQDRLNWIKALNKVLSQSSEIESAILYAKRKREIALSKDTDEHFVFDKSTDIAFETLLQHRHALAVYNTYCIQSNPYFLPIGTPGSLQGKWGQSSDKESSWKRRQMFENLLNSERIYLYELLTVVDKFLKPLKSVSSSIERQIISSEQVKLLFCNFEILTILSAELLDRLESGLQNRKLSVFIYDIFMAALPHIKLALSKYFSGYVNSIISYEENSTDSKFCAFVHNTIPNGSMDTLKHLLLSPRRKLKDYAGKFADIFSTYDTEHDMYSKMKTLSDEISELGEIVEETLKRADAECILTRIYKEIVSEELRLIMKDKKRTFLKEYSLKNVNGKKGSCKLHLFSDVAVIITSIKGVFSSAADAIIIPHDKLSLKDTKEADKISIIFSGMGEVNNIIIQVQPIEKASIILFWAKLVKKSKEGRVPHPLEEKIELFYEYLDGKKGPSSPTARSVVANRTEIIGGLGIKRESTKGLV